MLTITTPTTEAKHKGLTHTRLQPVLGYIRTHLDRDLSLAELAEVINISPTYFASLFKQTMEISPRQYVIQQRVEQAKLMLSKTDLAITDIALQVGFSSQSHLTQQFKRFTGLNLLTRQLKRMQSERGHYYNGSMTKPDARLLEPNTQDSVDRKFIREEASRRP